ncbi:hypothetical protein BGW39_003137, partial [Mortierella sp. 14UC]
MIEFPLSTSALNAPGLSATPLAHRSLSAPSHLQLSTLDQDTFVSGQLMPNKNYSNNQNDYILQNHHYQQQRQQQQILQQHLNAQFPATPAQQAYDQQQYLIQSQLHMGMHHQQQQQQQQQVMVNNNSNTANYTYQQAAIHPFQMDMLHGSLNQAELSSPVRVKFEFPNDSMAMSRQGSGVHPAFGSQDMDDAQVSTGPLTYSPSSSSMDSSSPTFSGAAAALPPTSGTNPSTLRSAGRVFSMPFPDSDFSQFELPEEFAGYAFPRHGSLGSLYPMTQSHELLDATSPFGSAAHHHYHHHGGHRRYETGAEMVPSSSSTSISSVSSLPPSNGSGVGATGAKTIKQRRASLSPDTPSRVFNCNIDDCGKLFKRSEHLKRHVRSVHTLEK